MTDRYRHAGAVAALLAAVLLASCGSATPTSAPGATSPAVPATTAPSGAAADASPAAPVCDDAATGGGSPAATSDANDPNAATYTQIEAQVQQLRGITATAPVARAVLDQQQLCAYMRTTIDKAYPDDILRSTETMLKQLLLIPETTSLDKLYVELYGSQAIGLYDDNTKQMYVISKDGAIGPIEEMTYAHEYTHALQDQKFGIKAFKGTALDQGDRSLARTALLEGDALLSMTLWAQQHLTPADLGQVAGASNPAAQAALNSLPAIIKDPLISVYTTGLPVVLAAFTKGGFGAVDALYANPPDSTEQMLHADKLASREQPVTVSFPDDLAARLGAGWKVSMQDTLGELQLGIILKEGGASTPLDAAAGWGGDRVALLEGSDGKVAVVLDTAWDTAADAGEFATAIEATAAKLNAAGRSASVLRPSDQRVVLISAESAGTLGRVANVLGLAQ